MVPFASSGVSPAGKKMSNSTFPALLTYMQYALAGPSRLASLSALTGIPTFVKSSGVTPEHIPVPEEGMTVFANWGPAPKHHVCKIIRPSKLTKYDFISRHSPFVRHRQP